MRINKKQLSFIFAFYMFANQLHNKTAWHGNLHIFKADKLLKSLTSYKLILLLLQIPSHFPIKKIQIFSLFPLAYLTGPLKSVFLDEYSPSANVMKSFQSWAIFCAKGNYILTLNLHLFYSLYLMPFRNCKTIKLHKIEEFSELH